MFANLQLCVLRALLYQQLLRGLHGIWILGIVDLTHKSFQMMRDERCLTGKLFERLQ
jgi:hypothetical protein